MKSFMPRAQGNNVEPGSANNYDRQIAFATVHDVLEGERSRARRNAELSLAIFLVRCP